jgi:hypothetical protein
LRSVAASITDPETKKAYLAKAAECEKRSSELFAA